MYGVAWVPNLLFLMAPDGVAPEGVVIEPPVRVTVALALAAETAWSCMNLLITRVLLS